MVGRLPCLCRRLVGLKSYRDPKTIKHHAGVAIWDVGAKFASAGLVDPIAPTSILNGVPAEEGGYNNILEDLQERDKIKTEPPLRYPIPNDINEPLSKLLDNRIRHCRCRPISFLMS